MIKILFTKYILVVPNCVPPLIADRNPENSLKAAFFSTLFYFESTAWILINPFLVFKKLLSGEEFRRTFCLIHV